MFNRWGFTTVFDIASVLDNTLALRRRIESGELRGPRIRVQLLIKLLYAGVLCVKKSGREDVNVR